MSLIHVEAVILSGSMVFVVMIWCLDAAMKIKNSSSKISFGISVGEI